MDLLTQSMIWCLLDSVINVGRRRAGNKVPVEYLAVVRWIQAVLGACVVGNIYVKQMDVFIKSFDDKSSRWNLCRIFRPWDK